MEILPVPEPDCHYDEIFFLLSTRSFPLSCSDHFSPPAAAYLQKEPVSVLSLMSMQVPAGCIRSPKPPPLLAEQSLSPEMPLAEHVLQIPDWLGVSLPDPLNFINVFHVLEAPN